MQSYGGVQIVVNSLPMNVGASAAKILYALILLLLCLSEPTFGQSLSTENIEPQVFKFPTLNNISVDFQYANNLSVFLNPPQMIVQNLTNPLVRVALFPWVSQKLHDLSSEQENKMFPIFQGRHKSDFYSKTSNFTVVNFRATLGTLHIHRLKNLTLIDVGDKLTVDLKNGLYIDGKVYPYEDILITEGEKELTHFSWDNNGGHDYRGSFTVIADEIIPKMETLRVTNILPTETYNQDVIPGEVYVTGIERKAAYLAQSIATRTFTFFKMAYMRCNASSITHLCRRPTINNLFFASEGGSPYDLVAGTSDQFYGGVTKENPLTNQAAFDTAGKVVVDQLRRLLPGHYASKSTTPGWLNQVKMEKAADSHSHDANFYSKILIRAYTITNRRDPEKDVRPQIVRLTDISDQILPIENPASVAN
jgi:hypothetical protein